MYLIHSKAVKPIFFSGLLILILKKVFGIKIEDTSKVIISRSVAC